MIYANRMLPNKRTHTHTFECQLIHIAINGRVLLACFVACHRIDCLHLLLLLHYQRRNGFVKSRDKFACTFYNPCHTYVLSILVVQHTLLVYVRFISNGYMPSCVHVSMCECVCDRAPLELPATNAEVYIKSSVGV